jgi:hypothetical protein
MGRPGRCKTSMRQTSRVREATKDRPVLYRHLTGWFEKNHKYLYSERSYFRENSLQRLTAITPTQIIQIKSTARYCTHAMFCEGARIIRVAFPSLSSLFLFKTTGGENQIWEVTYICKICDHSSPSPLPLC